MTLEIYWAAGSPFAWRALLTAELKRIPYESKLLEFSKGHTRTPEFLALNPRGKVPAMRDGNLVLAESLAIMAYLDRKHPEPPIFGRTAEETGRIWTVISEFESYMRDAALAVNAWMFGGKPRTPEIDDAVATVKKELDSFVSRLGRGPFVVGESPTAADIAWFPFMRTIVRAGVRAEARAREIGLFPFAETHPTITAWIPRIEALPGYDRTFPAHWR